MLRKGKGKVIPLQAQKVGRGLALLFHDRGTKRGRVVSSMPRPHFTPGKDLIPILHEAGWAPGPVWTGGNSRPHLDSIPDRPSSSQSLYRLSYRAHQCYVLPKNKMLDKHRDYSLSTVSMNIPRIYPPILLAVLFNVLTSS